MKTVQAAAMCTVAVWLVCAIAGATGAVFYTKTKENDYPRIGRRAFFTLNEKGSRYPRIGRSSPPGPLSQSSISSGNDVDFRSPSKRSNEFSLIARRAREDGLDLDLNSLGLYVPSSSSSSSSSSAAHAMTSLEEPEPEVEVEDGVMLPLGLLFFIFDTDGDKKLSREEFVRGMQTTAGTRSRKGR